MISLCPDVTIESAGHDAILVPPGKPGLLLVRMALTAGRAYGRDFMAESIWPECEPEVGRPRLRFTLTVLRGTLGLGDAVAATRNEIGLDWSRVDTDVDRFRRTIRRAEAAKPDLERADLLTKACEELRGDLAEQHFASWLDGPRIDLGTARIEALGKAAAIYSVLGNLASAEVALLAAIALDPMRESLHGELMKILARQDRQSEALSHFDAFRRCLQRKLGLDASESLLRLARSLTRSSPKPAPSTPSGYPNDGSIARAFFGRDQLLAEIRRAIRETALVTLVGLGGAGKTRLALELYRSIPAGGARFVDLSDAQGEADVYTALRSSFDVRSDDLRAIFKGMRAAGGLLILDNCEQVVETTRAFVTQAANEAPNVQILVTSRRRLGAPLESVIEVPGLPTPEESESPMLDHLRESPAIRLFEQAARAASPGFELTTDNSADSIKLVRSVDGLPLSIELAAARLRLMPIREILVKLERGEGILSSPHRPERQRSVSDIVEWSISNLSPAAHRLLYRLSVFAAGWNIGVAEAVLASSGYSPDEAVAALEELLDNSLVNRMPDYRFRILESIRPVALRQMAEVDDEDEAREAHLRAYLGIYEPLRGWWIGPDNALWRRRIQADLPNIRLALQWAAGREESDQLGERLARAVWRYWASDGLVFEAHGLLRDLLDAHPHQPRNEIYAEVLTALSRFAMRQGRLDEAYLAQNEAIAISRVLGDVAAEATGMRGLAEISMERRDAVEAERLFRAASARFEEIEDWNGVRVAVDGIGRACGLRGDYLEAVKHYETSVALGLKQVKETGDFTRPIPTLNNLGDSLLALGELDRACGYLTQALELVERAGELFGQAIILTNLGSIALEVGDLPEALRLYSNALTIRRGLGDPKGIGRGEVRLGIVAVANGQTEEAELRLRSAISIFDGLGDAYEASIPRLWLAVQLAGGDGSPASELAGAALSALGGEAGSAATGFALLTAAHILLHAGRVDEAAALIGASQATRTRSKLSTPRLERDLEARTISMARSSLGEEIDMLLKRGRDLTEGEALRSATAYLGGPDLASNQAR